MYTCRIWGWNENNLCYKLLIVIENIASSCICICKKDYGFMSKKKFERLIDENLFENYLIVYVEILSPSRISVTGYNFHQHHQWHIDICKTPTTINTLMKWKHNTKATLFGWHWCYPLAYFLPILFDYFLPFFVLSTL